jgi:hypothetical protein
MSEELVQYIRRGGSKKFVNINGKKKRSKRSGGKRIGVLVGWKARNSDIKIGWSICHKNDKFDSIEGLIQAKQHAIARDWDPGNYVAIEADIPRSIRKKHARFIDRAVNCFGGTQNGVIEVDPT